MRRLAVLLLAAFALTLLRVEACATTEREDAEARLEYLSTRITAGDLPGVAPGHPFDGEWTAVTLSMTAVAATNLALRFPETRSRRREQVTEFAARLASDQARAYDTRQWGHDALETLERSEGHAGYLGHLALAMDAACLLGGTRDAALHERLVAALARRIDASPSGLIETYPGERYVPDTVVVMAAVAQFDACVGQPRHAALIARWLGKLRAQWLDPDNGILVFAPGEAARGSGAAWNSFYLPFIDEAFAADQSARTWATFGDTALGGWLHGLRERPVGDERAGDVDSGPLVMGISASATGFALADATLRGRRAEQRGLLRTAELVGLTWGGRYLTAPLVGDAIVLAAKTTTRWSSATK